MMGGDTLRKSIKTNLGSCRLLSSKDVVELLETVEEELEVELGQPVGHSCISRLTFSRHSLTNMDHFWTFTTKVKFA